MTADSITIDFSGRRPTTTLPIQGIAYLDVSTGKRQFVGFARGAALGVLGGSVAGLWVASKTDCGHMCGFAAIGGLALGGGMGFIVGSAIGVLTAPDRWEEVLVRPEGNEAAEPVGSSLLLGLSIAFGAGNTR